ncbi:MAG: hypothetical protein QM731_08280 [Chitinophagaceae bacterium]
MLCIVKIDNLLTAFKRRKAYITIAMVHSTGVWPNLTREKDLSAICGQYACTSLFARWMSCRKTACCLVILLLCFTSSSLCQDSTAHQQDTVPRKKKFMGFVKETYRNAVTAHAPGMEDSVFFQKSEQYFYTYAGKFIRAIYIRKLRFGQSVLDTTRRKVGTISRIANKLQTGTKDFIIDQLLFIHPGDAVSPYRMADNERYLRDFNFIKDARIYILPLMESPDSVDVEVVVRDVFSWGGSMDFSGVNRVSATIYDANLFGRAQRLQYTMLYDKGRSPVIGSQYLFRKYSAFGTFTNIEAAYTTINRGASLGDENETATYIRLDRPLYTPDAHIAGGLELSWNHSANSYTKPDSLFLDYRYRLGDVWIGYNIGARSPRKFYQDDRKRMFAAIRVYDQNFLRKPVLKHYDLAYTNKLYILGQFSWYQYNFYRTNYIYGFGRTEDLPVGFTRKLTLGHASIDSLRRIYFGWEYDHALVDGNDNYWSYVIALGSNYDYKGKQLKDNSLLFSLNWFSPLLSFKKLLIRQFTDFSYTGINKIQAYDSLLINNDLGLNGFNTDSLRGVQRLTLGSETSVYTRCQLLGFKIGFFAFGKATLITPQQKGLLRGDVFSSLGGGIRVRNENLIFGTIECRFMWFPRTLYNVNAIEVKMTSNLRLRFSGSFVQAPWYTLLR